MLYYLFEYLEKEFQFPGASLFGFITFRAAMAVILFPETPPNMLPETSELRT